MQFIKLEHFIKMNFIKLKHINCKDIVDSSNKQLMERMQCVQKMHILKKKNINK